MVKLALGMIVFNGMPFVRGTLETWYPHVEQIVIAQGPVLFWQGKGYDCSNDGTVQALHTWRSRYDTDRKIILLDGQWRDKLEMCQAWFSLLRDDITHVACFDADEFMHDADILLVKRELDTGYDSVGLMLRTFVGGFERHLTGFEQKQDTIRFLRRSPGDEYMSHRPPSIGKPDQVGLRHHLYFRTMAQRGVYLYHYSHVLPSQVKAKEQYYAHYIGDRNVIPNYYENVWKPWVLGDEPARARLEQLWGGIHDFHPRYRGECYSEVFCGYHPRWIEEHKNEILEEQARQIG